MEAERRIKAGTVLIAQGAPPDAMYEVVDGRLRVERTFAGRFVTLGDLGRGEIAGHMELIDGYARLASVIAVTDCRVKVTSRSAFERMFEAIDPLFQAVTHRAVAILRENHEFYVNNVQTTVFMQRKSGFAGLSQRREFPRGTVLMRQGDTPETLYVIDSGVVEITRETDGRRMRISQLGRNCLVGEVGLIDLKPRSATVTAVEDVNAFVVSKADFRAKFEELGFFKTVMMDLAHAIRMSHEQLAPLKK